MDPKPTECQVREMGRRESMTLIVISSVMTLGMMESVALAFGRDGDFFPIIVGAITMLATGSAGIHAWRGRRDP